MKAYNLHGVGKLVYEDIDKPSIIQDWCLVKVKAAGICSSDIPRIYTKGTYHFPTIPGHEFSGEVVEAFDQNMLGKRVGVFPLIPCKKCIQCKEKHYEMCENYDYLGSRRNGGFAEFVLVPIWNLVMLPEAITYENAAMLEPLSVALHAVKKANISKDCSFAVVGTGMIALSAAQWAMCLGAGKVYVIGRNESKRAIVGKLTEVEYINSNIDSLPQVDVSLEAVGTPQSIVDAINVTNPGGQTVMMGNPSGNIELPQDVYWRILRKQLCLNGTWNSYYDGADESDWTEAVRGLTSGMINVDSLISHTYDKEKLIDGLEMMRRHLEPYCKVMTIWK